MAKIIVADLSPAQSISKIDSTIASEFLNGAETNVYGGGQTWSVRGVSWSIRGHSTIGGVA